MKQSIPYAELDTPAILLDMDKFEANISRMAHMTTQAGLKLRPHSKIHRSTYVAHKQIEAGACGIGVAKLSEAKVYVDDGIKDVEILHPFCGEHKMRAFKDLVARPEAEISCMVDMVEQADAISQVGIAVGKKIPVLMIIDNQMRFGVQPGEPFLKMAKELIQMPGIELVGIMYHSSSFSALAKASSPSKEVLSQVAFEDMSLLSETAQMLRKEGIQITRVEGAATATVPGFCHYAQDFPEVTEVHPGGYVYGDWMYITGLAMTEEECATSILTTVVSTPTSDRAPIDGGSKTFSADPLLYTAAKALRGEGTWKPVYGTVKGRPDIKVGGMSEEIGILHLTDPNRGVSFGDRLEILPNRISFALNLKDKIYGVRNGVVEREIPVSCRGMDY